MSRNVDLIETTLSHEICKMTGRRPVQSRSSSGPCQSTTTAHSESTAPRSRPVHAVNNTLFTARLGPATPVTHRAVMRVLLAQPPGRTHPPGRTQQQRRGRACAAARTNKVTASREFVQRLVDQHPPTQSLMQRLFPSMLLSLLRKPVTEEDAAAGAPPGGPNWPLFWRVASSENHHLAGLIWDEATRYQLRMCATRPPHCAAASALACCPTAAPALTRLRRGRCG